MIRLPFPRRAVTGVLAILLLAPVFSLAGCMSPEDRAFFGRGWLNPSELDEEDPPPRAFTDPTAITPGATNTEEY
jgi:hypothetical protein